MSGLYWQLSVTTAGGRRTAGQVSRSSVRCGHGAETHVTQVTRERDSDQVLDQPRANVSDLCMDETSLRVPGHHVQDNGHPPPSQQPPTSDNLSLRSAEKRLELLHDVVSIRSSSSRHRRPRSVYVPPKKTIWQRFKDVFRTVIAFVFSNVGICVLVLVYLILGRFNTSTVNK